MNNKGRSPERPLLFIMTVFHQDVGTSDMGMPRVSATPLP